MSDDYHSDRSRKSNSELSRLKESPKLYHQEYLLGKAGKTTSSMLLGSMVHTMVLEPEKYVSEFIVEPKCDKRTKDGKTFWGEFLLQAGDRTIVSEEDNNKVELIANAILSHAEFATCMSMIDEWAVIEKRIDFDWQGTPCRCKPDLLLPKHKLCVDLKTTADATPEGFAKSVASYGYHRQQAFYSEAIKQAYGEEFRFLFAVVETSEPYNAAVYELDAASVDAGRQEINLLLDELERRTRDNDWTPEYSKGIVPLTLPRWYRSNIYEG